MASEIIKEAAEMEKEEAKAAKAANRSKSATSRTSDDSKYESIDWAKRLEEGPSESDILRMMVENGEDGSETELQARASEIRAEMDEDTNERKRESCTTYKYTSSGEPINVENTYGGTIHISADQLREMTADIEKSMAEMDANMGAAAESDEEKELLQLYAKMDPEKLVKETPFEEFSSQYARLVAFGLDSPNSTGTKRSTAPPAVYGKGGDSKPAIKPGRTAFITGLNSRPKLNGTEVTIKELLPNGRVAVQTYALGKKAKVISVLPEKLEIR